jgi:hypothetical protein
MKRKLPPDAFDFYVGLGISRSYQAVASKFGATKGAVVALAKREGWKERLAQIEAKVRKTSDERAAETLEEIRARHLKAARIIQGKAIEALQSSRLETAMEAVRALELGVRTERLLIGEPTDRNAISVEEIIKREMADLLVFDDEPRSTDGDDGEAA